MQAVTFAELTQLCDNDSEEELRDCGTPIKVVASGNGIILLCETCGLRFSSKGRGWRLESWGHRGPRQPRPAVA